MARTRAEKAREWNEVPRMNPKLEELTQAEATMINIPKIASCMEMAVDTARISVRC